jgi:hypothetical protein
MLMVSQLQIESIADRVVEAASIFLLEKHNPQNPPRRFPKGVDPERAYEAHRWIKSHLQDVGTDLFATFEQKPDSDYIKRALSKWITKLLYENEYNINYLQQLIPDPNVESNINVIVQGVGSALGAANAQIGTFKKKDR